MGNSCDREFLPCVLSDFPLFVSSSIHVVYRNRIDEASEGEVMVPSEGFVNERSSCSRVDEGEGFDGSVYCDWNAHRLIADVR